MVRRGSVMVRRGSVGSASACCKAGPSSILGSAPQGSFPHWAHKRWGYGERLQRMATDECIVIEWMYLLYVIKSKINKKSGILPPNLKNTKFTTFNSGGKLMEQGLRPPMLVQASKRQPSPEAIRYMATLQMKGQWESNTNVWFPYM